MTEEKKKVTVKIIQTEGASSLVEFENEGLLARVFVPRTKIKDGECSADVLDRGVPYGVPWETLLDFSSLTPEWIAQKMRAKGIWTLEDLLDKDRVLIRIGTDEIAKPIFAAAERAKKAKRR